MAITRLLVIICLSHHLLKRTRSSEFEEPYVQEGVPYSLNCSTTLNEFMQLSWTDGAGKSITRCKDDLVCDKIVSDKYEVKVDKNNSALTSMLTKRNVTVEDRGSMFICQIVYKKSVKEKKWKLSKTYYLPSSKCEVDLIEGQAVHLSCETLKVHPGITCDIFQRHNGTERKLNFTIATKKKEHFPGYVSENCSVIIYPRLPGEFEYCVNVKVKDRDNLPYEFICTKNITIRFNPTLNIIPGDSYTQPCPGENMQMKCELLWLQSSSTPTMFWYLDDKLVNSSDTLVKSNVSLESTYNYESFYSFIPNYPITRLKCEVDYENNLRENITKRTINATKEISPILPPKILYQGVVKENGSKLAVAGGQNVSLNCVTGSVAFEASTVCRYSSHSIQREITSKASISFVFENYTSCWCYAIHVPEHICDVYFTIIFIQNYSITANSAQFNSIYFIIPALILLFAAGIFITLVVYLKKRQSDFHIYRQGCHGNSRLCCLIFHNCAKFEYSETSSHRSRSSDKKSRKSRENTTPYSVVDIINKSDAPGTDTNLSNHKEHSGVLQTGPPPSPEQKPHMSSFSSPGCSKLITTENDGLNISHGPFLDNYWSTKGNSGVNDKRQEETPLSSLPPPLPPRSKHSVKISRTPDSPLCKQGDSINRNKLMHYWMSLTRPTTAERFHDEDQYSQSVPKRRPPPIPCRSNVINCVQISSSDFCDRHNRPDCHVVHEHIESKVISSGAEACTNRSLCRESPDYLWPPPPTRGMNKIKTKKTRHKMRNTSEHPGIKASVKDDRNFKKEQTTLLPSQQEVDNVTIKSRVQDGQEIPPNKCINHVNKNQRYRFSEEDLGEINNSDWNHGDTTAGCRESGSDLSLLSVFVNTESRSSLDNDFVSDITSPS